jgi:uncharacterized membrane protein
LKGQGEELAALQVTLSEEKEANEVLQKQKKSLREMMVSRATSTICMAPTVLCLLTSPIHFSFFTSPFHALPFFLDHLNASFAFFCFLVLLL